MKNHLVFALVLLAGCSSKDEASPTSNTAAFSAVFSLAEGARADLVSVPFPSDLLLDASGAIKVDPSGGLSSLVPSDKGARYIAEALAETKGFGVYGGALFALKGDAPDPSRLPTGKKGDCQGKDSPTYIVDVDAGTVLDCRVAWNDDNVLNEDTGTQPMLSVQTARGIVLPEKHRIVALVTSALVGKKSGAKLTPSADFTAIRDGKRTDANARLYQEGIDKAVAKLGIDKNVIVAAAVYTTGAVSSDLFAMRDEANKQPLPALKWDKEAVAPVAPAKFTSVTPLPTGFTASLDDMLGKAKQLGGKDDPDWDAPDGVAHDALGTIGVAEIDAPNLLIDKPAGFADPKHATAYHDAAGKVAINPEKPTNKVWVSFFLPKAAAPAEGYPVVVYQHGVGGNRGDALTMANSFARKGWATVSIDAVKQGTRGASAVARGDKIANYQRAGAVYAGPDGFTDPDGEGANESAVDLFGGLFRLAAMRDQFRQAAVDHSTLYRVLAASPTLEGLSIDGKAPKLDGSRVAFFGISLGGILGSLVASIEPGHKAYLLQVPGGAFLSELATYSPYIYGLLNGSTAINFGFRNCQAPPWHPMVQLLQHVLDGGDPIGLASFAVAAPLAGQKPRNVLMFEAIADDVVPNESTEALARAMGLKLVAPAVSALADLPTVSGIGATNVPSMGATGVLVQVSPAAHGSNVVARRGSRHYALTRARFGDPSLDPFPLLPKPIEFENPYLETQDASIRFIEDAFAAKVPTLNWTTVPTAPKD